MSEETVKVAVRVRPFVPDRDAILFQIFDIRVARDKPQKLMNDRTQVKFLGRDQGKAARQIKAHLVAENRKGARACPVGFFQM